MSQNNIPPLYAGLDVAKATLQLSLRGASHALDNDAKGHARLIKLLRTAERESGAKTHVVLEATGGYESAAASALHKEDIALSIMLPSRVRAFARAKGRIAKSDPIDADMLTAFGQAITPGATPAPSPAQTALGALTTRRAQLVADRVAEDNRAAHYQHKLLLRQHRAHLALLEKQIEQCEEAIAAQIAAEPAMQTRAERLQQVPGIGPTSAAVLLAEMPELGQLTPNEAAALAGLAPYNCDSGKQNGPRRIKGGRTSVRCALYMPAMNAIRYDPVLKAFYTRLCERGKKRIVALTAVMRKLIILLNHMLKNPAFKLKTLALKPEATQCGHPA
jgi:transposase